MDISSSWHSPKEQIELWLFKDTEKWNTLLRLTFPQQLGFYLYTDIDNKNQILCLNATATIYSTYSSNGTDTHVINNLNDIGIFKAILLRLTKFSYLKVVSAFTSFITFVGRSAHLAHLVHKSGHKTSIITLNITPWWSCAVLSSVSLSCIYCYCLL